MTQEEIALIIFGIMLIIVPLSLRSMLNSLAEAEDSQWEDFEKNE